MSMEKDPKWKQKNPTDQAIVILSSLEGWVSNLEDKITPTDRFLAMAYEHIADLKKLIPFLEKGSW